MANQTISTKALLCSASNQELAPLVAFLTKPFSETLTATDRYKRHHPNHRLYAEEIYEEIKAYGGNTFVNLFRGSGPDYSEVLFDAAKKIGVKDIEKQSVVNTERKLIEHLFRQAIAKSKDKELEDLYAAIREAGVSKAKLQAILSGAKLSTALGPQLYFLVISQISRSILYAMHANTARAVGGLALGRLGGALLGPIGLALTGAWAAFDLSGPAYRVTIPCVVHIAALRQEWACNQEIHSVQGAFDG